ncbi:MAG TPA: hypothetical protein VGG74_28485 [Kofleriaceae bacterium]|jgi:hypothetical protein
MKTLLLAIALAACGPSAAVVADAPPDASIIPTSPAGSFAVTGVLDLQVLPAPADALIAELTDATDGPDDPARFLCDRLVTELPSSWQAIAAAVADDVVAPVLQAELNSVAPDFAPGIHAIAAGLGDLAHHARTVETLAIQPGGYASRTITGVTYDDLQIDFATEGMADAIASTSVTLDASGALSIAEHSVELPYGRLLRLGLDREIVPNVDFSASDLSTALADLVDCTQLGQLFAAKVGIGSVTLYATACTAGMAALAADVYDRLDTIDTSPFQLAMTGSAIGVDLDGDGTMDRIDSGLWTGSTSYNGAAAPLADATFTGTKGPSTTSDWTSIGVRSSTSRSRLLPSRSSRVGSRR